MLAVDLLGPLHVVFLAPVMGAEAPDVQGPQVQARLSLDDPFGDRPPCPAARGDPEGVESHGREAVFHLRRRAEHAVAVRREGLRPVDQPRDPGLVQAGRPFHGGLRKGLEVVEVRLQQLLGEAPGDAVDGPGDAVPFVSAHDEPPDLLLVVEQAVLVPQGGQVRRQPLDGLGHQVLMWKGTSGLFTPIIGPISRPTSGRTVETVSHFSVPGRDHGGTQFFAI